MTRPAFRLLSAEPSTPGGAVSEHAAVRRLLQRVGLGARPGETDAAARNGFDVTLTGLMSPAGRDAGVAATPPPGLAPLERRAGKNDADARTEQRQEATKQTAQLGTWWLDRMAAVDEPLPERMTWFWHGHFATSAQKVRYPPLMLAQNETLRRLGRGDFRTLAQAMIIDPAMLVWLDGGGNRVGRPNENLAREFMELFTLGVGHYTEDDVRQAARALTGWRVDFRTGAATQDPRDHDAAPKTVLGTTAPYDAAGLTDLLVTRPASPTFLAGRIWRRLVSDTPPSTSTLDRLVAAYGPGHDVTALVRAIAGSEEFRSAESVLVRPPVDWLVGALRALRLTASALKQQTLTSGLRDLGQIPLRPPDVGGWPSGPPWLSTAAALARLQVARELARTADLSPITDEPRPGRVEATAALLGLDGFGSRTTSALAPLAGRPPDLVAAALASPENTVSA
ncbi:DUF1800 domain-containing protein [Pseudonocardia endophytica]|uniref:Uncharacterized protein (DUF1800 family) n=1 Tax=Pseudonocardia endophytica TaxID=401976 RepID=A0A4R1HRM9_PSEEN|nr:DUF1800 domain-containing protein [Pseudonocardia endophytica]TCK22459.1 uncharacterized protein (DUF1800 family) [Pseudonocardia endophytica]